MKRLLIFAKDRYPPFRVDLIELFSRHIIKYGFKINWLMLRAELGPAEEVRASANECFLVMGSGCLASNIRMFTRTIVKILHGYYDIIQVRDHPTSALLFLLAARFARRPFVYWMSFPMVETPGDRARDPNENQPYWRRVLMRTYSVVGSIIFYRGVLRWADHVFVQSNQMKDELVAYGIKADKLTPVPMGVSTEIYNPKTIAPCEDRRLDGRTVLVYVGTTLPRRRVDIAVHALAKIVRSGRDAVLVICGEQRPNDEQRLYAIAAEEKITDRLIFTGHLPLKHALGYVLRSDICLSPYPSDSFYRSGTPTKLVEYLAMGRAVVANDHPDQSFVLSSSGAGILVPMSPEGFADGINQLLSDPQKAAILATRGPEWVKENRSYTALSLRVTEVYDQLIKAWNLAT